MKRLRTVGFSVFSPTHLFQARKFWRSIEKKTRLKKGLMTSKIILIWKGCVFTRTQRLMESSSARSSLWSQSRRCPLASMFLTVQTNSGLWASEPWFPNSKKFGFLSLMTAAVSWIHCLRLNEICLIYSRSATLIYIHLSQANRNSLYVQNNLEI